MTTTEIAVRPVESEWSVERIVEQTLKIQQCMSAVMRVDEHYGVIPGTKGRDGKPAKPTLLKAGAEKLCLMFRFDPEYEVVTSSETPALFSYTIRCILWHIPTGARVASGLGSCNSREKKYVRAAPKKCPQCDKEAIIKGQEQYGGGWLCWKKKDGCGAKFIDGAEEIEKQGSGVDDPSDLSNTILKMACKRALVAAVLNGTAASDCFTQDLEDLTEKAAEYAPPKASADPSPKAAAPTTTPTQDRTSTASGTSTPSPAKPRAKPIAGGALPANDVKAKPGDPASKPNQYAVIHQLREQIAGWAGDHTHPEHGYSQALRAYKKPDGSACASSKDLTYDQAANLIRRMQGKADKNNERAAQPLDVSVVIPIRSNGMTPATMAIIGALKTRDMDAAELCSIFGVDDVTEIANEDGDKALALVFAWGTPKYGQVLAEVTGVPQ